MQIRIMKLDFFFFALLESFLEFYCYKVSKSAWTKTFRSVLDIIPE